MKYKAEGITMNAGDKILLYTDGVPDTKNSKNEFYGTQRLMKYLEYRRNDDVKNVLAGVRQNVLDFQGAAEPFDDLTMLVLEYAG